MGAMTIQGGAMTTESTPASSMRRMLSFTRAAEVSLTCAATCRRSPAARFIIAAISGRWSWRMNGPSPHVPATNRPLTPSFRCCSITFGILASSRLPSAQNGVGVADQMIFVSSDILSQAPANSAGYHGGKLLASPARTPRLLHRA